MASSGTMTHRVTLHAPAGTRGDGTAHDLATHLAADIEAFEPQFQQRERQAVGGVSSQVFYLIDLYYRSDVQTDLRLVEECHARRTFEILQIVPDTNLVKMQVTCVVGPEAAG